MSFLLAPNRAQPTGDAPGPTLRFTAPRRGNRGALTEDCRYPEVEPARLSGTASFQLRPQPSRALLPEQELLPEE
jgi:hypothetical protein